MTHNGRDVTEMPKAYATEMGRVIVSRASSIFVTSNEFLLLKYVLPTFFKTRRSNLNLCSDMDQNSEVRTIKTV